MIRDGFQSKLLLKLNAVERTRLEAEAVRKENAPRPRSTIWSDFRRSARWSWGLRRDLQIAAIVLACVLIALLALELSPILFLVWMLALCLVVLYGTCRLLCVAFNVTYVFFTCRGRE
jgi:Ca2+/Na+ antiporter